MIYVPHIIVTIFSQNLSFVFPRVRAVHNGQSSIQYYSSLIWNMIAGYIEDSETLGIFKAKIQK